MVLKGTILYLTELATISGPTLTASIVLSFTILHPCYCNTKAYLRTFSVCINWEKSSYQTLTFSLNYKHHWDFLLLLFLFLLFKLNFNLYGFTSFFIFSQNKNHFLLEYCLFLC